MLAQNFLAADALYITDAEREALIKVLHMLERGELVHAPDPTTVISNGFNMSQYGTVCSTILCIGGWTATVMGVDITEYVLDAERECSPLHKLYWGWTDPEVTPEQGAFALRNFLTTGEPNWEKALSA